MEADWSLICWFSLRESGISPKTISLLARWRKHVGFQLGVKHD